MICTVCTVVAAVASPVCSVWEARVGGGENHPTGECVTSPTTSAKGCRPTRARVFPPNRAQMFPSSRARMFPSSGRRMLPDAQPRSTFVLATVGRQPLADVVRISHSEWHSAVRGRYRVRVAKTIQPASASSCRQRRQRVADLRGLECCRRKGWGVAAERSSDASVEPAAGVARCPTSLDVRSCDRRSATPCRRCPDFSLRIALRVRGGHRVRAAKTMLPASAAPTDNVGKGLPTYEGSGVAVGPGSDVSVERGSGVSVERSSDASVEPAAGVAGRSNSTFVLATVGRQPLADVVRISHPEWHSGVRGGHWVGAA
jgi:hypothetical protein